MATVASVIRAIRVATPSATASASASDRNRVPRHLLATHLLPRLGNCGRSGRPQWKDVDPSVTVMIAANGAGGVAEAGAAGVGWTGDRFRAKQAAKPLRPAASRTSSLRRRVRARRPSLPRPPGSTIAETDRRASARHERNQPGTQHRRRPRRNPVRRLLRTGRTSCGPPARRTRHQTPGAMTSEVPSAALRRAETA
jgi:hypothetical protein